jgi:FimV-like protein
MGMDEMQIEEQHAARSSETMLGLNDSGINDLQGLSSDSELGTKLDLAKAYIDMGDSNGALSALEEVLKEGDNDHAKRQRC